VLTPDWLIRTAWAAALKDPSSTTARKYRN
jgi:hypothetical protein